ncbi:MAG: Rrf2 family transcriptional regulator [Acidobacteriota bacterium]
MKLSKETEYGIRGLIFLANYQNEGLVQVKKIAQEEGLPQPLLARTFHQLARAEIVTSFKGRKKGFSLSKPPEEIFLTDIITAIEGPDIFNRCIFWSENCYGPENPCPLHFTWSRIKESFVTFFQRITLADLVKINLEKQSFSKKKGL